MTLGGRPSYVPALRCAPCRTSYGARRPSSGRPPRARWPVRGVASAPCADVVVRQIKVNCCLRRAPAQRTIGGVGRAGVCACWGFQPWWLSPVGSFSSPGTGGDQEPGGGATGGGFALLLDLTFACCTPARTLVGLRLPGEENDPTSEGTICAALGPSPRRPIADVKFRIHGWVSDGVRGEI